VARGLLRVYLGAAPGVGKTFAMLGEGHRRKERGTDVVVAFIEDHGRARTRELVEGLEVVPRQQVEHRGATFTEMDLEAVLLRRPQVALVDELAHTNVPGVRNAKRWQDVDELLDAGIDVITTVNVQHLESLNDVVESITGVTQRETVPDEVVRRADQIELVDMSPEALRRRMAHGNVYPAERIDAALTNYFRLGNLSALRELALLWVADRVDEGLDRYRHQHGIDSPWAARERIVVALTGGPEGDTLIRRGARIAGRSAGRDLMALHVVRGDGVAAPDAQTLERQRVLVESLGGTYHSVVGDDVAEALLEFARSVNASQLVIGASRRGRLASLVQPWTGEAVVRDSGDIDVHVVTHERSGSGRRPRPDRALSQPRLRVGWGLALLGPWLLTGLLELFTGHLGLATDLLLFLALTVAVALVGGLWPAVVGAVLASLLLNYFFTPPIGKLTIAQAENALSLVVFVVIAIAVAVVVDASARRADDAARASAEAAMLSTLAGDVVRADAGLDAMLARLQESFGLDGVSLVERLEPRGPWTLLRTTDPAGPRMPEQADATVPVDDQRALLLRGHVLDASERRVVEAFAAYSVALLDRDRLRNQAEEARRLIEVDALRTAILAAVSHDVRTPLAGIKAAVSSLRQPDVALSEDEEDELTTAIEDSADRLDALLSNLLDLSRLQVGGIAPRTDDVALADVVAGAATGLPGESVDIDVSPDLAVRTDAGLLERVVANLLHNAVRFSPTDEPVRVTASENDQEVRLAVADRGPGVRGEGKVRMFEPFQRLGDAPDGDGIGLGLAVARGLTESLGGHLEAEDTPGGGLTMIVTLPDVASDPVDRELPESPTGGTPSPVPGPSS
jgi:two-component system, OmpR family, sensor histidine kinase KdpD